MLRGHDTGRPALGLVSHRAHGQGGKKEDCTALTGVHSIHFTVRQTQAGAFATWRWDHVNWGWNEEWSGRTSTEGQERRVQDSSFICSFLSARNAVGSRGCTVVQESGHRPRPVHCAISRWADENMLANELPACRCCRQDTGLCPLPWEPCYPALPAQLTDSFSGLGEKSRGQL